MDPIANLDEQRALADRILRESDENRVDSKLAAADRLAKLVVALDEWRYGPGT